MIRITYDQLKSLPNGTLVMNDDRSEGGNNPNYLLIKDDDSCLYYELDGEYIDDSMGNVGIGCVENESLFIAGDDYEVTDWYNTMQDGYDVFVDDGNELDGEEVFDKYKDLYWRK